jgi:DNA replication initiation complex subunit (GINS family)
MAPTAKTAVPAKPATKVPAKAATPVKPVMPGKTPQPVAKAKTEGPAKPASAKE